jgi:ubiquinone/menaquinone biosynthesis C-methylase UbiE
MVQEEFDKFADEYRNHHAKNIRMSGENPEYFAEYKIQDLKRFMPEKGNNPIKILDFGCGTGNSTPWLKYYFPKASVVGLDVSKNSLEIAESRFKDMAAFMAFDGSTIPFKLNHFDAAIAACVFHHISPERHMRMLSEIHRILNFNGRIMIHEHNPLNPLTRHAVNNCPFDENAILIRSRTLQKLLIDAGFQDVKREYRIFFPRFLRSLRPTERHLRNIPFGAQYFVTGIKSL